MENQLPEKKTLDLPNTEHTSLGLEGKVTQAVFFINEDYQPIALVDAADANGCERMLFVFDDGTFALFEHINDCCESVSISDVCGDVQDLIGLPLLLCEEATQEGTEEETGNFRNDAYIAESVTWTFYRFQTAKGDVVVRWLGCSNGYYSEAVEIRTGKLSTLRGERVGRELLGAVEGITNGENRMNAPKEEKKDEMDLDAAIPGLAQDAVVDGGVDPSKDDEGCEGGACKI